MKTAEQIIDWIEFAIMDAKKCKRLDPYDEELFAHEIVKLEALLKFIKGDHA